MNKDHKPVLATLVVTQTVVSAPMRQRQCHPKFDSSEETLTIHYLEDAQANFVQSVVCLMRSQYDNRGARPV